MFKDSISTNISETLQQRLTRTNKPTNVANDLDQIVENPVAEISRDIFRLESDIRKLTLRVDQRLVTRNIQDSLNHFRKNFDAYFDAFKTPANTEAILASGKNVATYGESVGHVLNRFSSLGFENRRLAQQIIQRSRSINNSLATKKDRFVVGLKNYKESDLPKVKRTSETPKAKEQEPKTQSFGAYAESLARSRTAAAPKPAIQEAPAKAGSSRTIEGKSQADTGPEVEKANRAVEEQLEKNRRHLQYFVANAKKAEAAYNAKYNEIKQLHNDAVEEIGESRQEIEELKSRIATNTVGKSFEQCAEDERDNANFYRYSAFAYMGVFFLLMGYMFWETGTTGFDWVRTGLRSLIALTLMIPCSYVARESRMHRQQQHQYMRTAVELKTLAPFTANLPESRMAPLREDVVQNGLRSDAVARSYSDYYMMKNFDLLSELNHRLANQNEQADTSPKN